MVDQDLKRRTKEFALRAVRLAESLPDSYLGRHVKRQLLRSSTSVAANYRAACRARSNPDFIAKMGIVEEECDESMFWMEFAVDSGLTRSELIQDLWGEADQLVAIFVSSIITARGKKR
jgi:four helix bundle protein